MSSISGNITGYNRLPRGRDLEAHFFGTETDIPAVPRYRTFKDALRDAKEAYKDSWDPRNPSGKAGEFYKFLSEALPGCEIEMYKAVGTSLDTLHGADGFIEISTQGRNHRVTFDITLNRKKDRMNSKADEVLHFYNPSDIPETLLKIYALEMAKRVRMRIRGAGLDTVA